MTFRLSKLHGLGNDFLVLLTDDVAGAQDQAVWSARAQAWCARHTGIGADGLILGVRGEGDADVTMHLYNSDGSRAEMSGNGIRCLAHAVLRERGEAKATLVIATDGGQRSVEVAAQDDAVGEVQASVDMGAGSPGPSPDHELDPVWSGLDGEERAALALDPQRSGSYDLGNPHLVLLVDEPASIDVELAGPVHESQYSAGMNVHFVAPTDGEADALDMVIWERGAGITEACGTGACAVALAAHEWGLAGERVTVHMPGGDVAVDLGPTVVLHGPSVLIAEIEVPA